MVQVWLETATWTDPFLCNAWHLRGIPHQTVAMITNMDFNTYTYCPFSYEINEFLSILEQQTQELNNMEWATGHLPQQHETRVWLQLLPQLILSNLRMKSGHLSEEHSVNRKHIIVLDSAKNLNDTWASLPGNSKGCLQTQENHQRNRKGYCPSVQDSKGEIGCNLLEWS